jgi:hypothetical protein
MSIRFLALVCGLLLASAGRTQTAPFDLAGPTLRVSVTQGAATLPIARVPQLAEGDRIDLRADLPADQAARYILVAGFLRGSTNPPPNAWFRQAETWTKKGRKGLSLVVPEGAQQIVIFLAPATGGDFPTLRNAVQGRPGAFVRAAQDLAQASLDRRRLAEYLEAVRRPVAGDPDRLERITPLLARSLQIKVNTDCLSRVPDLQAACLMQNQDALVLNDGHSNAITDALAGPGVDLALQISATPQGGLGQYSPYIAAARDIIGIFSSLHTAKYQYIPALARLEGDAMHLVLNSAPSFHNPKSVMVAALPIVAPVRVPPLQPVDPELTVCKGSGEALLPMIGAPLIYATDYAYDLRLRLAVDGGRTIDLPATPDPERGGLVLTLAGALPEGAGARYEGRLHGSWGFQPFDGPQVAVRLAEPGGWRVGSTAARSGGRQVTLEGGASACVSRVSARGASGEGRALPFKAATPETLTIDLPEEMPASDPVALEISGPTGAKVAAVTVPGAEPRRAMGVSLLARNIDRPPASAPVRLTLGNDGQIPADAILTASLRATDGQRFTGRETIEISAEGGSGATATLNAENGMTLADRNIAVIRLQPARALGTSAYGQLRARVVRDKVAGEWVPLGMLVRLPEIRQLRCAEGAGSCELTGDRLYLIASVAATEAFDTPVAIAEGFPGNAIQVPRPAADTLFIRLHDDPAVIGRISGASVAAASSPAIVPEGGPS